MGTYFIGKKRLNLLLNEILLSMTGIYYTDKIVNTK